MSETRKLKVTYRSSNNKYVPAIILQGKWLEQYGFPSGTFISVECEDGKLIITPREPEPGEEKRSLEDRVAALSKSQRKKLSTVLDDIESQA